MEPKAAKSCFQGLEDQTREREALYGMIEPPEDRFPRNAGRASSDKKAPLEKNPISNESSANNPIIDHAPVREERV